VQLFLRCTAMAAVLRRLAQTASLAASLSVRRQSSLSAGCSYLSASSNTALPVNAMTAGLGGALEEVLALQLSLTVVRSTSRLHPAHPLSG